MSLPLECEGAPRDLGRAQGVAAREAVHAAAGGGGALRRVRDRLGLGGALVSRWQRDLRRYFPHQHEWLEGVARGAGVPDRALLRAALALLDRERDAFLIGAEGAAGPVLWRTKSPGASLRRVAPEGRFVSVELASALLACPWIGVNEAGLAVAVTGGRTPGPCAAHAALLARDCLERFESVESALAWCLSRPAAAGAEMLLADARGELAGVDLQTSGRRVRRPEGRVLVLGGVRSASVAKILSSGQGDPQQLERALAEALGEPAAAAAARADPTACSLRASRDAPPERVRP